jgi:hypothetical protein
MREVVIQCGDALLIIVLQHAVERLYLRVVVSAAKNNAPEHECLFAYQVSLATFFAPQGLIVLQNLHKKTFRLIDLSPRSELSTHTLHQIFNGDTVFLGLT